MLVWIGGSAFPASYAGPETLEELLHRPAHELQEVVFGLAVNPFHRAPFKPPVNSSKAVVRVFVDDLANPLHQKTIQLAAAITALWFAIEAGRRDLKCPAKPKERCLFALLLLCNHWGTMS